MEYRQIQVHDGKRTGELHQEKMTTHDGVNQRAIKGFDKHPVAFLTLLKMCKFNYKFITEVIV